MKSWFNDFSDNLRSFSDSDGTYSLYETDRPKVRVQMIPTISTEQTIPAFMAVALKARITVPMMTSWQRYAFVTQFTIETC